MIAYGKKCSSVGLKFRKVKGFCSFFLAALSFWPLKNQVHLVYRVISLKNCNPKFIEKVFIFFTPKSLFHPDSTLGAVLHQGSSARARQPESLGWDRERECCLHHSTWRATHSNLSQHCCFGSGTMWDSPSAFPVTVCMNFSSLAGSI